MVMHEDHPATCWCCQHLLYCPATPDYSDETPGSPAGFVCDKDQFRDFDDGNFENLHAIITMAQTCPEYSPKKEA